MNTDKELKKIRNRKELMLELKKCSNFIGMYAVCFGIALTKYDVLILTFIAAIAVVVLARITAKDGSDKTFYAFNHLALWVINLFITFVLLKMSSLKLGNNMAESLIYALKITYIFIPTINLWVTLMVSSVFFKKKIYPKLSFGWELYVMSCAIYIPYASKDLKTAILVSCFAFGITALVNLFTYKDNILLSLTSSSLVSVLTCCFMQKVLGFPWYMFSIYGSILVFLSFLFFNKYRDYQKIENRIMTGTVSGGDRNEL